MFDSLLIANRGEIACRIIRTARRLGIRTIAVYSDADREALHVSLADEAWHIGPAPAAESYLVIERLLEVAQRSGAAAVHPGYGFLAENATFAEACQKAGLVFVGPPIEAIRAMGDKGAAKAIMAEADVPLVPGYHGDDQDPATLSRAAGDIGFPLLVKATAGGGGKGMRVVRGADELEAALQAARREAASAFGDDRLLLERYLEKPRHVEIQVFADSHGNVLHLFERDCSVQRRHQKIIEEAPAPGLDAKTRRAMGEAAVRAARAIGYVGAGTVEFLLDADGAFYFMEMNTRLQVEHPVTEMITGQDLVAWQLAVAAGEPLPLRQEELAVSGHAIEVRIYAEDPARDFLPSIGRLEHLHFPPEDPHLRIDTGVRSGDEVSMHYDPMIAKLIVHDSDRPAALRRLRRALEQLEIVGVTTNAGFLARVARHPEFDRGPVDTWFVDSRRDELLEDGDGLPPELPALAALFLLLERRAPVDAADPWSPWNDTRGWRLNSDNHHPLQLGWQGRQLEIIAHYRERGFLLEFDGNSLRAAAELTPEGLLSAEIDGCRHRARVVRTGAGLTLVVRGRTVRFDLHDPRLAALDATAGGDLSAPMPGKIVSVLVEEGARVERGTPLMVLEAMKMEHTIKAPADGVVSRLNFQAGSQVSEGEPLLLFDVEEGG